MPDGIPLHLVAVRDVGRISASFLLGTAEAARGAIELSGLSVRYEALPVAVLGDTEDAQAMSLWSTSPR